MTRPVSGPVPGKPVRHAYRWLAVIPPTALLGGIPFANRVEPYLFGLPFLLFWIVLWVLLTGPIMGLVYMLDEAAARRAATDPEYTDGGYQH
jgi:hypothetical protein